MQRLRPVVLPYTREHLDLDRSQRWSGLLRIAQLLVGALSFVVAVNLAILVYARTVTRLGEIAVRTALGASRRRILAQLFIEALALSVVGAAAGLVLARTSRSAASSRSSHANGSVPFWIDFDLSIGTVIYAFGLAVLAAVIMGVLPGLKATGAGLNANLHELNGRTRTRLGPMWTTLVVAQVAVAVAVLPVAVTWPGRWCSMEVAGPGFAAETGSSSARRLSDEPSAVDSNRIRTTATRAHVASGGRARCLGVTFSSICPGLRPSRQIRFEDLARGTAAAEQHAGHAGRPSQQLDVGVDMFDALRRRDSCGTCFNAGDLGAANAVIVNRSFVQTFLEDRQRVGSSVPLLPCADARQPARGAVVSDRRRRPRLSELSTCPAPGRRAHGLSSCRAGRHPSRRALGAIRRRAFPPASSIAFEQIGAEVDPALQLRRVGRCRTSTTRCDRSGAHSPGRSGW